MDFKKVRCFLLGHDWHWIDGIVLPFLRCYRCWAEKPIGYGMRASDFR